MPRDDLRRLDAPSMSEHTLREMASVLAGPTQAMTWRRPPRCAITFFCSGEGTKGVMSTVVDLE
jgi:hypothetical protein